MAKPDYPITPAIRFLREHNIAFEPKLYPYVEHGGTAVPAQHFGVDEHAVVKTIVLENDKKQGLICIMHGDKHISTRNLARELGMKHIEPAQPNQASKWTGYLVGGTSHIVSKTPMTEHKEESRYALSPSYIYC